MIDYDAELEEMTATKNLMNSYKLYFLKALIVNAANNMNQFSFYDMACWMCAYSFSDVCNLGARIRPLDRLYDVALLLIERENLLESSKISEVYVAAAATKSKQVIRNINSLCNYVPYRLLAYLWPRELKGKTDKQKNQFIEEQAQNENRCIYSIVYVLQNQKASCIL
ncbi:MAG: hypothetical protein K2L07_04225 [Lachnospiraceae bacterium]|nr:hypothetical protein [Lachnospiraceae bacterium]